MTSNRHVALEMNNDLYTNGGNHNLFVTSGETIDADEWHFICATFNGSTVNVYVDGNLSGSGVWPWGNLLNSTYPLCVGRCETFAYDWYYAGKIDDIRIYNRALSSTEVAQLYTFYRQFQSLSITGVDTVNSGATRACTCTATFSGGITQTISTEASWSFVGTPPAGTYFVGNTLVAGTVSENTPITIKATYTSDSVTMMTTTQVIIVPGLAITPEKITSDAATVVGSWINCNAKVTGNSGPLSYVWSFPGASATLFTKTQAPSVKYPQNGSYVATVTVSDQTSTCVSMLPITVNCPPAVDEPTVHPALVGEPGLVDTTLYSISRKANGLVIIVHGIFSGQHPTAEGGWMRTMGDAITNRVSPRPNVVLYDWHTVANEEDYIDVRWVDYIEMAFTIKHDGVDQGRLLKKWIEQELAAARIDPTAKIHLIGHSAGCFVVGECALKLGKKITQVTMLDPIYVDDTPFLKYPMAGGRLEAFFISGFSFGFPGNDYLFSPPTVNRGTKPGDIYGTDKLSKTNCYMGTLPTCWLSKKIDVLNAGMPPSSDASWKRMHSWTYEWYTTNTVMQTPTPANGFYYSPLLNNGFHGYSTASMSAPKQLATLSTLSEIIGVVTQQVTGCSTFGNVTYNSGTYTVTEQANAGIFKTMTMPNNTEELVFRYRYASPGDGDFLSVHWGTNTVLYIGRDTAFIPGDVIDATIDMTEYRGQTDMLTFKLVSRGATNAVIELSSIGITLSNDPDNDGLTNDEEAALGTNPLKTDTDGDGLGDGEEVNTYHTNPLLKDSDGDGMDDDKEIACGTNPMVSSDVFAVTDITLIPGVGTQIRWPSVTGKSYDLLKWTNLTDNAFITIGGRILATAPTNTFTDDAEGTGACFYWLRIAE